MDSKKRTDKLITDAKLRHEKFVKTYPLPPFQTPFPTDVNPFHFSEKQRIIQWQKWFEDFSLQSPERFEHIKSAVMLSAACYPNCKDLDRYENMVKMMLSFFVLDDHLETAGGDIYYDEQSGQDVFGQYNLMLDKLVSKNFISMSGCKPYIAAMYIVFDSVCSKYNEQQKHRLVETWKYYMNGCVQEQEVIRDGVKFKSVEEMEQFRVKSIGSLPSIQFIEYSDDICVEDRDWKDTRLQRLMELIGLNCVYTNDMFSFEKEIRQNPGHPEHLINLVALYHLLDGCTYADALEKVAARLSDNNRQIKMTLEQICSDQGSSKTLKEFAHKAVYIASGSELAQLVMDRYHIPQKL